MMQDVSLAASFGRLAVVAVLMAAVFYLLRRIGAKGRAKTTRTKTRALELVDRQAVGKTQSIAVFRVHDYTLVVGITEQRVELLTLLDPVDRDHASTDDQQLEPMDGVDDTIDDTDTDGDVIDLARIEFDDETERFLNRLRNRTGR